MHHVGACVCVCRGVCISVSGRCFSKTTTDTDFLSINYPNEFLRPQFSSKTPF